MIQFGITVTHCQLSCRHSNSLNVQKFTGVCSEPESRGGRYGPVMQVNKIDCTQTEEKGEKY